MDGWTPQARAGLDWDWDWDWVEGHGTVTLRLLIRFWGTRTHRAGRRGEAPFSLPPPHCWLRNLADLGAFPRTDGQKGWLGGFSIWGSTPRPRLTRWGTR